MLVSILLTAPSAGPDQYEAIHAPFVGGQGRVKVHFQNFNERADVDVFPEPPLTIQSGDGRCKVDGGVWVRNSVHLSSSGRVPIVQEYSGSSDELVFYSTQTCKEELRIDVSGAKWSMSGERFLIGRGCTADTIASCPKVVTYELDKNELPAPASAALKAPGLNPWAKSATATTGTR